MPTENLHFILQSGKYVRINTTRTLPDVQSDEKYNATRVLRREKIRDNIVRESIPKENFWEEKIRGKNSYEYKAKEEEKA